MKKAEKTEGTKSYFGRLESKAAFTAPLRIIIFFPKKNNK